MSSHFTGATRRLAALVALLVAITVVMTAEAWADGASPSASPSASSASNGRIVFQEGRADNPDNLNPFVGWQESSYAIWDLVYDGLVTYDSATLVPRPNLAESWEMSSDGLLWTFHIRHGVKWSDGQPLTAHDVAFTYTYIIDNQLSAFTPQTVGIKKVIATDDYTVQMHCSQPLAKMLTGWLPILPEHIWSKVKPAAAESTYVNQTPIVGSGPFQCVEFKRNSYVKMVANKDYWMGAPHIDELWYRIYTNNETMSQDLQAGTIDFTGGLGAAAFKKFQKMKGFTAVSSVSDQFRSVGFNDYTIGPSLGNPVLRDPEFRRALSYAVDRDTVAKIAWQGLAEPASTLVVSNYYSKPDWHWQPPADVLQTFDLEKAKQMLDAAGYKDTDGDGIREFQGKPIELRLWALNDEPAYVPAGKLITTWWKSIGLKVDFGVYDPGYVNDHVFNIKDGKLCPDFDAFVWGWIGAIDPDYLFSVYLTNQIGNLSDSFWSNPEYDKLYVEQSAAVDPEKRKEILWKMQEIFYNEAPALLLVYPEGGEVYNSDKWEGFFRTPANVGNISDRAVFLSVRPRQANLVESGRSNTGLIVGIVAAVVIVGVVAIVIFRRRAGRREEVA